MFNPANLANEVFGILRSFDYVVNIFDFDGNRVYEPADARRFFASPKNITVSVHEDGENSSIKMFLSKSTDVNEVSGLISTMRSTASKFGLLFNVRKYERELKPKDLAPNGASDFDAGVSLSSAEETPDDAAPAEPTKELEFGDHVHDPEAEKLDRITGEVSSLAKNFKEIVGLLHSKKKVKESMTIETTTLNEADESGSTYLPAFGLSVETEAWQLFKGGKIAWQPGQRPDMAVKDSEVEKYQGNYEREHGTSLDHDVALRSVRVIAVAKAIAKTTPELSKALLHCLDLFTAGNGAVLVTKMLDKAIEAAQHGDNGDSFDGVENPDTSKNAPPANKQFIAVKEFRGQVERQAWQDFVNDHIDFSGDVDFNSVRMGPTANKLAIYLNLISAKTRAAGLGNLFSTFATDIDDGRATPFKVKVAKHAIEIAKHGKVEVPVGESIIMSESIRAFGAWFDSMSQSALMEGGYGSSDYFPYDDRDDKALDIAYTAVKEEFSVDEFLESHGSDFNWGDDTLADDDKVLDYDYVASSLTHYLQQALENQLDGAEYPSETEVKGLATDLMPDVISRMADEGFVVQVPADDAEPVVDAQIEEASCETCIDGACQCPTEGEGDASTELSTEDVLLPSRADDDLSNEVTAHHDTEDMDRIISLARGKAAQNGPRFPQP